MVVSRWYGFKISITSVTNSLTFIGLAETIFWPGGKKSKNPNKRVFNMIQKRGRQWEVEVSHQRN